MIPAHLREAFKLVIAEMYGGLGNQMFIYAMGYATAKMNQENLTLELCGYETDPQREFMLDHFQIDPCKMVRHRYINKPLHLLHRASLRVKYRFIKEKKIFTWQGPISTGWGRHTYLRGYWQSEKYFIDFAKDIRRQFKRKQITSNVEMFLQETAGKNSVAVHVRRGDYLTNGLVLDMDFYDEAIEIMNKKLDAPVFYFFSDDPVWTSEHFGSPANYHYVTFAGEHADLDEFTAMSQCSHIIIANSTFSWWAAWLNENPEKIVVAPEVYFWRGDYFPEGWVKLEARLAGRHINQWSNSCRNEN